jgi:subtilisin family serine protease
VTARAVLAAALLAGGVAAPAHARTYVVLYRAGVPAAQARAAVERAGGRVLRENRRVGVATVRARSARALRSPLLAGVAREPRMHLRHLGRGRGAPVVAVAAKAARREPLAGRQWDMRMIHATATGSYAVERGSHAVRVGVMDTGVEAAHPDIAPNYDRRLSRDFTGARRPGQDPIGHGTHVAGTIAAALNGFGMAGVAPGVDLVSLRVGDDNGIFGLQPTVDALTYAGDHGIDVVNMSYFIDPWLYNCPSNPADTPDQQREQQTILQATQRAVDYARAHGVTLVSALGNEHTDLGHKTKDTFSPDYPAGRNRSRDIDAGCLDMPTEANGVIGVSAVARSGRKASYSDYGLAENDLTAPGGDRYDLRGTRVLGPVPASTVRRGDPGVVRSCAGKRCAYYEYIDGTSMASPHVAGVAALIVARNGQRDPAHAGLTLAPDRVEQILDATAHRRACPQREPFTYPGLPSDYTATCEGTPQRNSFFGSGLVDALAAVQTSVGTSTSSVPSARTRPDAMASSSATRKLSSTGHFAAPHSMNRRSRVSTPP